MAFGRRSTSRFRGSDGMFLSSSRDTAVQGLPIGLRLLVRGQPALFLAVLYKFELIWVAFICVEVYHRRLAFFLAEDTLLCLSSLNEQYGLTFRLFHVLTEGVLPVLHVHTEGDLPFVTFPNKKRQEVAKIAEIFLTPMNIGKPEILLFLRPFS